MPRPPLDLDVVGLTRLAWKGRLMIFVAVAISASVGVAYILLGKPLYRAEVVVARSAGQQANSSLAQLGGLASLAGISLNAGGDSQTNVAVLNSRALSAEFIESLNLIPALFPESWDEEKGAWSTKSGEPPPDILDAVLRFKHQNLLVSEDKKTGLIVVAVVWSEPIRAAELANALVLFANAKLQRRALNEAQQNVTYLQNELATTSLATLQSPLARLLEAEMQKLLIARGSKEFAFEVVDGATPPKRSTRPGASVILPVSIFIGAIAGFLMLLFRAAWSRAE